MNTLELLKEYAKQVDNVWLLNQLDVLEVEIKHNIIEAIRNIEL